jgi:hypothetical protein
VTGFGVGPDDMASVGRSLQAVIGPIHTKAQDIQQSTVSGGTVGEPYFNEGDQYHNLIDDIGEAIHDCAVRIEGISRSLSEAGKSYGAVDSHNTEEFGSINPGGLQ